MYKIIAAMSVLILFLVSFGFGTNISFAENTNNLTYNQVIQELEETKKYIASSDNLSIQDKDKLIRKSYAMVNKFLDGNNALDDDKKILILDNVNEIDNLLYDVNSEKNNIQFGNKSIKYKKNKDQKDLEVNGSSVIPMANEGGGSYSFYKGDILISLVAKTAYYPHGHAAIMSTISGYVVEAIATSGVVHNPASIYWGQAKINDEELYYVRGAADSAYLKAFNYANAQVGEPYKLKTSLSNTSEWYCSKLVYKAWENAGYKVGSLDASLGVVLPASIKADYDTVKYSNMKDMF